MTSHFFKTLAICLTTQSAKPRRVGVKIHRESGLKSTSSFPTTSSVRIPG
ncbi:UDP-glucose:glycoprotein glucosyltransferase-like protein [Corchorus olitorius]|uniref:UDP-glucose:glycoprotein glucosyltransferase-like protein n=1 Tax=Corchorus olitorius TaxID=93759 RepID=A0A1R3KMC3_9ROSI|nr:UDP-glucose:glycoprotein glucosyltransferase-like protein [Corchorus olitorius]